MTTNPMSMEDIYAMHEKADDILWEILRNESWFLKLRIRYALELSSYHNNELLALHQCIRELESKLQNFAQTQGAERTNADQHFDEKTQKQDAREYAEVTADGIVIDTNKVTGRHRPRVILDDTEDNFAGGI